MHPDAQFADGQIPRNDIAILHLTKPLKFTKKINSIALPSTVSTDPKYVFVGRGTDESGRLSKSLKTMDAVKLSTQECVSQLPKEYQEMIKPQLGDLEKAIICAKRPDGQPGICSGDSGSPLVQESTLIGLASFIGGMGCSNVRLGFYVNVATYVPWIKSVTKL
ncbi:plasma kallikrein-like [Epargyreus clarus]|uniref:plasma kallikrein-like n=1 Tax=Epargyreus clarus TaxID=520877 RepID=UPI003C30CE49